MATTSEAASPASAETAQKGDGQATETTSSGNLTVGQASAKLFAATTAAEAAREKPAQEAADQAAPEKSEELETPAAEAPAASVEAESEEAAAPEETPEEAPAEDEADSVPSQSTSIDDKTKAKIQKVVDKEKALRKAAEAQTESLKKELDEMKRGGASAPAQQQEAGPANAPVPMVPGIPSDHPVAKANDQAALDQLKAHAKQAVRWAEEVLDTPKIWKVKVETDPGSGEETTTEVTYIGQQPYSKAEVKSILRNAKVTLEDHIPAKAQFLSARQSALQIAHQKHPFLRDKQSPEYQRAQSLLRDPWLQQRPDAEWIAGVLTRGFKAMDAEDAAVKTAAETKPKAKAPVQKPSNDQTAAPANTAAARVPVSTGVKAALAAEEQKLAKKGGITTAEAIASLQNRERIRNSR